MKYYLRKQNDYYKVERKLSMLPNSYLYEKLSQAHYQELFHEADQQRLLAQLPRRHPHLRRNVVRRFAAFLMSFPFSTKNVVPSAKKATGQL